MTFRNFIWIIFAIDKIALPCTEVTVQPDQSLFAEGHYCHEFDGWLQVRQSGISVDFRWILRVGSGSLRIEKLSVRWFCHWRSTSDFCIGGYCEGNVSAIWRCFPIVRKSIVLSKLIEDRVIENETEYLLHLRHPCITAPIGFGCPPGWQPVQRRGHRWQKCNPLQDFCLVVGLTVNNILFDSDHDIQIARFFLR
jgi:hypothetical protein